MVTVKATKGGDLSFAFPGIVAQGQHGNGTGVGPQLLRRGSVDSLNYALSTLTYSPPSTAPDGATDSIVCTVTDSEGLSATSTVTVR